MMQRFLSLGRRFAALPLLAALLLLTGCDALFGAKQDATTEEIFDVGRTDPTLFNEVEYVPLFPFYSLGGDGAPLAGPTDVFVGFDEFIYVTDSRGLHVLDLAGRPASFVPIPGGATSVTQDRKFDLYVTARRDTFLNDQTWNLAVVYHLDGVSQGSAQIENIIWHPFDDDTRQLQRPDPSNDAVFQDEAVEFTGVSVLPNNNIYVSRRGPVNDPSSAFAPHNSILEFNNAGVNVLRIPLTPDRESLISSIQPADVLTFVAPPQREFFTDSRNFLLAQNAPAGSDLRFGILSIIATPTSDGIEYGPDTQKLQVVGLEERGDGFLYEEGRFSQPTDLAFAGDETQYIFAVDAGTDSLYVFTSAGVEGVAPPAGAQSTKPVLVSFGGTGDGALQFNDPQGVAYFDRIVYVADQGNNRISRFRLNTDFE